jgi:hypothetical protein
MDQPKLLDLVDKQVAILIVDHKTFISAVLKGVEEGSGIWVDSEEWVRIIEQPGAPLRKSSTLFVPFSRIEFLG